MRNLALMWVLACVAVALLAAGDASAQSVSTFTDTRDGKVYKIVKIGSQVWFAENLNYAAKGSKCYGEDGKVTFYGIYDKNGKIIDATFALSYAEVQANCTKYGRLYNWETALKACPAGWHLPSGNEWTTLVDYVGGSGTAGTKLKSTAGWYEDGNGTDGYGFSALPGGVGNLDSPFYDADLSGIWWSTTEYNARNAWYWGMSYDNENVDKDNFNKTTLSSVRCVLDDEKESQK